MNVSYFRKGGNILYIYILLAALPLLLVNFSFFSFMSPGNLMYSLYNYSLYLLLPIILMSSIDFKFSIRKGRFLLIYIMILLYFISSFAGVNYNLEYSLLFNTILYSLGIFIFLGMPESYKINEIKLKHFMKSITYFVLLATIYNILANIDLLIYGTSNLEISKQFASFFSNRNTFGLVLVIGITTCTYLLFLERETKYLLIAVLFFINLIWTDSTNSFLSTVIFLAMFFFLFYKKNYVKKILIFIVSLILFFILYRKGYLEGIINFIQYGDITEFSGRIDIWLVGLNIFLENLFFGVGIGQSQNILFTYDVLHDQFHNTYIEILVSGGIILFLIYSIIGVYIIFNLYKVFLKNRLIGSVFLAAFISLLFSMFFESRVFFGEGFFSGIVTIFYIFIPLSLINYWRENN